MDDESGQKMVEKVAIDLHGTSKVQVGENIIDFKGLEKIHHVQTKLSILQVWTSVRWTKIN